MVCTRRAQPGHLTRGDGLTSRLDPHLATLDFSVEVEDLLRRGVALQGPVEDRPGGDEGNGLGVEPPPERDRHHVLVALQTGQRLQIEDLENTITYFSSGI